MLDRYEMQQVREAKDPHEHERHEEKGNQARLDLKIFNNAGKPPATLIREQTTDQAEHQSAHQQGAKRMQKNRVRQTPIE
jgi:hypothetical protein